MPGKKIFFFLGGGGGGLNTKCDNSRIVGYFQGFTVFFLPLSALLHFCVLYFMNLVCTVDPRLSKHFWSPNQFG